MNDDLDVLIVGAGPVGLLMAVELQRQGLRPRIVEKRAAPSDKSKALGIQMRTLELFEDLGLLDVFLAAGNRVFGMNMHSGGTKIARIDLSHGDSHHHFILVLPQSRTEALVIERLEADGGRVERELQAVALEQHADHVITTLRAADGTEEQVRSRWVVGCDGAHSFVRQAAGIAYEGEDLERVFCFADVDADLGVARDEAYAFLTPEGIMLWLPLPEPKRWRIVASIGDVPADAVLADLQGEVCRRTEREITFDHRYWETTFSIRQRRADRYRQGRVFLAGDAAHCHSPLGGQGMNTGLQDAYNLAWKLALVTRGDAADALLDSYAVERMPVAHELLKETGRATRAATLRSPVGRALRNRVAGFATRFEAVQQRIASTLGETIIGYGGSPIVGEDRSSAFQARIGSAEESESPNLQAWREFGAGPRPGERAPDAELNDDDRVHLHLRGPRHTLLLFDGAASTDAGYENLTATAAAITEAHSDLIDVVVIVPEEGRPDALGADVTLVRDPENDAHARYGARSECAYLIRPDGYIGYRQQPVDAQRLTSWFSGLLGQPAGSP